MFSVIFHFKLITKFKNNKYSTICKKIKQFKHGKQCILISQ